MCIVAVLESRHVQKQSDKTALCYTPCSYLLRPIQTAPRTFFLMRDTIQFWHRPSKQCALSCLLGFKFGPCIAPAITLKKLF